MNNAGQEKIYTDQQEQKSVSFKRNESFKDTFMLYQGKAIYNSPPTEPETEEWEELA